MTGTSSRLEITRDAVAYLEANLGTVTLQTLSDDVHVSKYHLHRVFSATTGLSVHTYVRRRRLTEAARLLAGSDEPIANIAAAVGYGSQQSFTDAFSTLYKRPPGAYRSAGTWDALQHPMTVPDAPVAGGGAYRVTAARPEDLPDWMALARNAIDASPRLDEAQHRRQIAARIRADQALIARDEHGPVGALVHSASGTDIDYLAVDPFHRRGTVLDLLLDALAARADEPLGSVRITTYRRGDPADTGHRRYLGAAGFVAKEHLVELGYPTQRLHLDLRGRTVSRP